MVYSSNHFPDSSKRRERGVKFSRQMMGMRRNSSSEMPLFVWWCTMSDQLERSLQVNVDMPAGEAKDEAGAVACRTSCRGCSERSFCRSARFRIHWRGSRASVWGMPSASSRRMVPSRRMQSSVARMRTLSLPGMLNAGSTISSTRATGASAFCHSSRVPVSGVGWACRGTSKAAMAAVRRSCFMLRKIGGQCEFFKTSISKAYSFCRN